MPEPSTFDSPLEHSSCRAGDRRARSRWGALLVFLFGLTLYIGTVAYDFVWDDHTLIVGNPYITQARYLPRYFTEDLARLTSDTMVAPYYRPLFWASLLLDFLVWGLRPAGFHLTNALLHALAGLLVFRLARSLLGEDEPALLAALLFVAHPSHVETVAMASARNEPLATLGVLLAVLGYHRARLAHGWRRPAAALGSLAAFAFGLLSKETAVSLPLILVWFELTFPPDTSRGRHGRMAEGVARLAPFFLVSSVLGWFRWGAVARWTAETLGAGTVWARFPGSLELVARYVLLAVLPVRLQPIYLLSRPPSLWAPWPLAGLALLILGAGLALWGRRRWPVASLGLGWFFIALAPVLDLMPVSDRALSFAPRYLFISTIGLALLAGPLLARPFSARAGRASGTCSEGNPRSLIRWVAGVAGALVFLGWTARTLSYLPVFRGDLRLFAQMAQDVPDRAVGHQNLGVALVQAGRTGEGLRALERAVATEPRDGSAQLALAQGYLASGRTAEGMRLLNHLAPWFGENYIYVWTRVTAHLAQKEWGAAVEVLTRGLRRYPEASNLHVLLGHALEHLGDLPRAEAAYRRALALNPDIPGGRLALAGLLAQTGRAPEAMALARAVLRLEPDSPAAWRSLALALEGAGDAQASRKAWGRVLELGGAPTVRAEARRHLSTLGAPVRPSPTRDP